MLQGYHSIKFSLHNYFGKKETHQKRYLYKIFKKKVCILLVGSITECVCCRLFWEIKIEIRVDGGDESNCNSTKA